MTAAELLDFWFGTPPGAVRREWFVKDAAFDASIRARFGALVERALAPVQRWFVYLPLEHAEDLALQQRSVALFEAQAAEHPALDDAADRSQRHRDVIARFGRVPPRVGAPRVARRLAVSGAHGASWGTAPERTPFPVCGSGHIGVMSSSRLSPST